MIGHQTIFKDLKKLADRGALSHSYLFFGPSMVGKKLAARAIAYYLEKKESVDSGLRQDDIQNVVLSDCKIIEPGDGGSIGIDAVREIKNFLWQKPNMSPRRTLVINDAELLTTEAQNALLKITEEPPASSLLILVASDSESLIPTILSRFQKIHFGAVPEKEIIAWLEEEHKVPVAKALALAKKSMGKPGLAWRLTHDKDFENNIDLAEKFLKSSPATRRDLIKKIIEPEDFDFREFLDAVIMVLAWDLGFPPSLGLWRAGGIRDSGVQNPKSEIRNLGLWHKTLALYDRQTNFSLNPRLQLENLLA
jgi:DNA polymerase III subunit delta'